MTRSRLLWIAFGLAAGCGGVGHDVAGSCAGSLAYSSDVPGNYDFVMCGLHVAGGAGHFDTGSDAEAGSSFQVGVIATGLVAGGSVACDNDTIITVDDSSDVDVNGNPLSLSSMNSGGSCTITTSVLDAHHWSASASGTLVGLFCSTSTHCGADAQAFSAQWMLTDSQ